VRLVVGKVTLQDVISTTLCGFLVFTQTEINKFFLTSRDFCGGGGLAKSQRGGG